MINKTVKIKGMHCASCASIITKKISKLQGVDSINVNFATENATLAFDEKAVSIQQMNNQIEKLGYTFVDKNEQTILHDHSSHDGINESKDEKLKELMVMRSKTERNYVSTIIYKSSGVNLFGWREIINTTNATEIIIQNQKMIGKSV
jgi:Cu2+-exporting ATPase/Cu+-exporting ATPase